MVTVTRKIIVVRQVPTLADKLIKGMQVIKVGLSLYSAYKVTKWVANEFKTNGKAEETKGE